MPSDYSHSMTLLVLVYTGLYAVMLDLCEDRSSCVVKASPETFTQDPCLGTSKYLEAHYKCRPNEFERQTACEGERFQISCRPGDRIVVYSAMFGRTPNGTDKCRIRKHAYLDCQATGALAEVNKHCQGRRTCAIQASESVFGDPCMTGIKKYLTVSYACVPKKILKRQHRRENNKKKKKKKPNNEQENADHKESESESTLENSNVPSPEEAGNGKKGASIKHNEDGTSEGNVSTTEADESESIRRHRPKDKKRVGVDNIGGVKPGLSNNYSDFTESSVSTFDVKNGNKDMSAEYNTQDKSGTNGNKNHNSQNNQDKSQADTKISSNNQDQIRESVSATESTQKLYPSNKTSSSSNKSKDPQTNKLPDSNHKPDSVNGENDSELPYVTERNLTVLCANYTSPSVRWSSIRRSKDEYTIGFLRDWFSTMYFLTSHQEKAWLYFTLGICFGIIVMLIVVLIKVCVNFRRNIRARLDVSEPTHRNTHTNNHSSLDAPMLEHSDSMDRIEVVRFSPRNTLRANRSNSHHRDLVNYYG